jgi:hypothetical protein
MICPARFRAAFRPAAKRLKDQCFNEVGRAPGKFGKIFTGNLMTPGASGLLLWRKNHGEFARWDITLKKKAKWIHL